MYEECDTTDLHESQHLLRVAASSQVVRHEQVAGEALHLAVRHLRHAEGST